MPPLLAAFYFLSLLFMAAPSLRLRHRHLIVALHGHQLMQAAPFLAVIVVALVFLGYERLNFRNDILALRKLLRCAQLVKLTLGSVVDDKIRFMRGVEFLLVLFLADRWADGWSASTDARRAVYPCAVKYQKNR